MNGAARVPVTSTGAATGAGLARSCMAQCAAVNGLGVAVDTAGRRLPSRAVVAISAAAISATVSRAVGISAIARQAAAVISLAVLQPVAVNSVVVISAAVISPAALQPVAVNSVVVISAAVTPAPSAAKAATRVRSGVISRVAAVHPHRSNSPSRVVIRAAASAVTSAVAAAGPLAAVA